MCGGRRATSKPPPLLSTADGKIEAYLISVYVTTMTLTTVGYGGRCPCHSPALFLPLLPQARHGQRHADLGLRTWDMRMGAQRQRVMDVRMCQTMTYQRAVFLRPAPATCHAHPILATSSLLITSRLLMTSQTCMRCRARTHA